MMSPGSVLSEAWTLYKAHWRHFLPIALVVYLAISLLTLLVAGLLGVVGALFAVLISIAGIFWLQGALVVAVADIRDGRADLSLGETLVRVRPHVNRLAVAGLLAVVAVSIGLAFLLVPGLVLLTWWILIVPAVVLERAGIFGAFGRSRELVRGSAWAVFGVVLATFVILFLAQVVIAAALFWLPEGVQGYLTNVAAATLTAPFVALAWTTTYYRLRREPV